MSHQPSSLLVKDLGEQGLLAMLQQFCHQSLVGDDAAVLSAPEPGQSLVVTTDILVDGVHFSDRTTSAEDVGWRAAAANLSDLAAMGADPLGITVGLCLTDNLAVSWVEQLYRGLTDCLEKYNSFVVGGDVCHSTVLTVAITAFGQVYPHRILRRTTAAVGDAIVVTGCHGASRAGLELLLNPEVGQNLSQLEQLSLTQVHQRPQPRLDVLHLLEQIAGKTPQITAMDSSDGLADAVVQICRASRVGATIYRNLLPLPPVLNKLVSPEQAIDWALYGGEDFELVLCLAPEPAQELVNKLGKGASIIGNITAETEVLLKDRMGVHRDLVLSLDKGFQHF
ncbi:MAG: thiamine-phosphate kinase [Coleofasciculaceae cyanobacterium]